MKRIIPTVKIKTRGNVEFKRLFRDFPRDVILKQNPVLYHYWENTNTKGTLASKFYNRTFIVDLLNHLIEYDPVIGNITNKLKIDHIELVNTVISRKLSYECINSCSYSSIKQYRRNFDLRSTIL